MKKLLLTIKKDKEEERLGIIKDIECLKESLVKINNINEDKMTNIFKQIKNKEFTLSIIDNVINEIEEKFQNNYI